MKNRILIAAVLATTMFATACSATWMTTFDSYLAVAGPVLVQVLELIALAQGKTVSPALLAKVQGDSKALGVLAQSVTDATNDNLPTACAAFNAGISTFAADAPTLEQIGQVSNPKTQAQIEDALALLQSTVSEIELPIAACQNAASPYTALKLASRVKSPANFVSQYNTVMARDETTKRFEVHQHTKTLRVLSFGLLK